jgi:hypothetical protein
MPHRVRIVTLVHFAESFAEINQLNICLEKRNTANILTVQENLLLPRRRKVETVDVLMQ